MTIDFGGVELKDVIKFQTKIMLGSQYGRISQTIAKKDPKQLIIACLRLGWNDAFRHVSENQKGVAAKIKQYLEYGKKQERENEYRLLRGKIKNKSGREDFDDYYASILDDNHIIDIFTAYASATSTNAKCIIITNNIKTLETKLKAVKKKIRFGHIQKLFNIAVKLYLCLYRCKDYLGLNDSHFVTKITAAFQYADCPIDSIILDRFEQTKMKEKNIGDSYQLTYPNITWSNLDSEKDIETYKKIQESFRADGKSSLYFDFSEWN